MKTDKFQDRMRGLRAIAIPLIGVLQDCNMCDADNRDERLEFCESEHASLTFHGIANTLFLAVTIQFPELKDVSRVRNNFFSDIEFSFRTLKKEIAYALHEQGLRVYDYEANE